MIADEGLSRRAVLGAAATLAGAAALPAGAAAQRQLGHKRVGTGAQPVLVLHEWLGDHQNYRDVLPYLSGDTYSYIFADLRGYGLSKEIAGDYSVKEAAADALKLMDDLGHKRFLLVGHSMSGMISQYIAMTAKDRIRAPLYPRLAVTANREAGHYSMLETPVLFASLVEKGLQA